MKRRTALEGVVFVSLVAAGVGLRVYFEHLPNFAPVAAMALFAGYFFRSALLATAVPLAVMGLSDLQIGGYDWRMMALVYGMLAAPVALRGVLRRHLEIERAKWASAVRALTGLVGCSLAASVLFFVTTNFGSWLWFTMYEHSWAGLAHCYVQALPFFRYTLTGDMLFALVLFGGYAAAVLLGLYARAAERPADATV